MGCRGTAARLAVCIERGAVGTLGECPAGVARSFGLRRELDWAQASSALMSLSCQRAEVTNATAGRSVNGKWFEEILLPDSAARFAARLA